MKLYLTKKVGQSGYELVLSVFFSFFLHAAIVILALILYTSVTPRVYIPPFYDVKLVGIPAEISPAAPAAPAAAPVLPKAEPAPVKKQAPPKARAAQHQPPKLALHKDAVPELSEKKTKPARTGETESAKTGQAKPVPAESSVASTVSSTATAKESGGAAVVSVNPSSEGFKFPFYLALIRSQIERNWNPPPAAKGTKAKVEFTILRSGRVFGDARLQEQSNNSFFDMAAKRAILLSSPFPPMPEDFFKDRANFSVDLEAK